jgi:ATP-grasp domain, R2K clade family 3
MKENPTWLVQITSRHDDTIRQEVDALVRLGFSWKDFGVIPFTADITGLDREYTNFVVRGGTKILSMVVADPTLWMKDGVFYDVEKFDQNHYQSLGLPLLNADAEFFNLPDFPYLMFEQEMFVKPSSDLKAFTAGIVEAGQSVQEFIGAQMHQPTAFSEIVLAAETKTVVDEYRFFVLKDRVITGSQYRVNRQLRYTALTDSAEHVSVLNVAKEYAKLYEPADVFTLDICKTIDGAYSIIEYNCFNASGLYACNVELLFTTISDFVRSRE